ncbi:hypothetical protein, partial [Congregibacter sp.]|uniref:hypothetical protein n=1 Tax=Congregibacter sp. TaxID=2744308 RepID=UPI003F6AFD06
MKTFIKSTVSVIALGLATTMATSSAAAEESVKPGVSVQQVVAKQLASAQQSKSGFSWEKHATERASATVATKTSASGFRWENVGPQPVVASAALSNTSQSEIQGYIWG